MSADQRVTYAREFLTGARKHKVAELPPSVLMREDAELRRQLGQVLDVAAELEAEAQGAPETAALAAILEALAVWETRDDTKAQPEVRRSANTAMDAIDSMVALMYRLRSRLVTEIRASDDATAVRVDAMLAEARARRCPDHRPVLDTGVGWYCAACGAEAPPDAAAPGPAEVNR